MPVPASIGSRIFGVASKKLGDGVGFVELESLSSRTLDTSARAGKRGKHREERVKEGNGLGKV